MNTIKLMLAGCTVLFLTSCACKTNNQTATIVSDCTGKYLRVEGKDYLVCNTDLMKNFQENAVVQVSFEKIENCPEFDGKAVCMMYHENEGLVKIKSIK